MNEEKINQILRNQMIILEHFLGWSADEAMKEVYNETEQLLNPPKEQSIKELTEDAFSKDGEDNGN